MKKSILILAAACVAFVSMAEEAKKSFIEPYFSTERSVESIRWGVRGGLNVTGLSNNVRTNVITTAFGDPRYVMESNLKAGLNIGVSAEIPILRNLFINTGLFYSQKGGNLKFVQDYSKSSEEEGRYVTEYNGRIRMHYFEVPVLASYRYAFNRKYELQVNLGPYFAVAATGNVKAVNDHGSDVKLGLMGYGTILRDPETGEVIGDKEAKEVATFHEVNINDSKGNYANRFDMGIQLGAGVTFFKKYYAGMSYEWGLVNFNGKRLRPISNNRVKNHNFNISVGYNF